MKTMVNIGVSKAAVREARKAINDILRSKQDQQTIQDALMAFTEVCKVGPTHISDCKFTKR